MKVKNFLKLPLFLFSLTAAQMLSLSSCNDSNKPEDTKKVAEEHNDGKFNTVANEKDAQFLVNAAETDLKEISVGQLAQQKSALPEVKALGKMLEDAHKTSLTKLTALAKNKQITVPNSPTNNDLSAYKDLSAKSGKNFDKEYLSMMVKGHSDAISSFEKGATECSDTDIKAFALSSIPDLRTHLDKAISAQKAFEKM